jgi:hypothetical protein
MQKALIWKHGNMTLLLGTVINGAQTNEKQGVGSVVELYYDIPHILPITLSQSQDPLIARTNRAAGAYWIFGFVTQAVGLGWYESGIWPLTCTA